MGGPRGWSEGREGVILEGPGGWGIEISYLAFVRSTKPRMYFHLFIHLFNSCLTSPYCPPGMQQGTE